MKKVYILLAVLFAGTLCFAEDFAPEVNLEETEIISASVMPYVAEQGRKAAKKSLKTEIDQNSSELTLEYLYALTKKDLQDVLLYAVDENKDKSAAALIAYLGDCRFTNSLDEIKDEALKRVLLNARKLDSLREYGSPTPIYMQAQVWYDLNYIAKYAPLFVTKTTDIEALKNDYIFRKSGIFSLVYIVGVKNGEEVVEILQKAQAQLS